MPQAKPIPEGFRTVTPHLTLKDAAKAIEWYKKAFGAEEVFRAPGPEGKGVMHAEVRIGDSMIMMADEFPGAPLKSPESMKGTTFCVHLYVQNVDQAFQKAAGAGAKAIMPVQDMFWGDRYGMLADPFGHVWSLATHKEDLSPDEIARRGAEAMKHMCKG